MERARNKARFRWAGDPERWGGVASIEVTLPAAIAAIETDILTGGQLLRAQTEDLIAVGWDLVATWHIEGLLPGDSNGGFGIEFTIGTGQTSSTLVWLLSTIIGGATVQQNAGAATLGWIPTPFARFGGASQSGVAVSAEPIIACAIAARPLLRFTADPAPHTVKLSVNAHCAPRSWVP